MRNSNFFSFFSFQVFGNARKILKIFYNKCRKVGEKINHLRCGKNHFPPIFISFKKILFFPWHLKHKKCLSFIFFQFSCPKIRKPNDATMVALLRSFVEQGGSSTLSHGACSFWCWDVGCIWLVAGFFCRS